MRWFWGFDLGGWVGGGWRHEAQAPSNQVKNYKQIYSLGVNEVVSRTVWSVSSVY